MANKVNEFLKEMTEATGLYGDELFEFIRKKCLPEIKEKEEKKKAFFPRGEYVFTGNLNDLREFYKNHGGSEEMAKWFGSMVPGLAAIHVASVMELERFEWVRPTKIWGKSGSMSEGMRLYSCWWKPEDQKYDFDDGRWINV